MTTRIKFEITDLIQHTRSSHSPAAVEPGITLNISELQTNQSRARFILHLTGRFDSAFYAKYHSIHAAPVILLQDTIGGTATFAPIDPHKRYAPHPGLNWSESGGQPIGTFTTFWIQMPIQVWVDSIPMRPSLFISAILQNYASNTLALNQKAGLFTSFKNGKLHDIRITAAP